MARAGSGKWIRRAIAGGLVLAASASIVTAQTRAPNYNFFDSREFLPGFATAAVRAAEALSPPVSADAETVARAFLEQHREMLAVESTSVFSLPLERRYSSEAAGLTHLVFRRQQAGIAVFGGEILVHVARDGSLLQVDPGLPWATAPDPNVSARLGVRDAIQAAMAVLAPSAALDLRVISPDSGADRSTVLSAAALRDPIPARLVWFPRAAETVLAWELYLHVDAAHWYCVLVNASSGELLFSHNLYQDDKPRGSVFRAPDVPHPNAGAPSIENFTGWPAAAGDCPASTYPPQYRGATLLNRCWVSATETAGNNAVACLDADGNNQCDWKASNLQAHFEFPFTNSYASTGDATPDRQAAITNLFYWNNVLHDWLYGLGFDEAAGNFQADNFGRGGFGGDAVLADAQDGSGLNNASFATPPDGSAPRMQVHLFTNNGTFLRRDGSFDGDLITHEYVHGLTLRLIGGPGGTNDLWLGQSGAMAEGWSDIYAASLTNDPVVGEYVSATPATGMRSVAYDNSPHTFGRLGTLYRRNVGPLGLIIDLPQVHRDGEIWATVLWDLRAAVGKTIFEQMLTTALKLTPTRPSMLDARNAILQAAQSMGVNPCTVWAAFAARGFGASAAWNHIQAGQANDTALSVYEAFDRPVSCGGSPPAPGSGVFMDDMEAGPGGWSATGLWHQTSRRAAGGTRSWWFGQETSGNYATGARVSGTLTSLPIAIPSGSRVILEWDQLFKGEGFNRNYPLGPTGSDPYLNFDSGWVLASRDAGATWDTVTTLAHNSDGTAFDHHKIDISRYAGGTIHIRFLFDTLDSDFNTAEGWYIDNVTVRRLATGTPALSVAPASLGFAATVGSNPSPQSLSVANVDGGVMNWTATAFSSGWLAVSPGSGSGNATLTVTARVEGLAAGTYNGKVTVMAPGGTGSPADIPVTLTVSGPVAEWRLDETAAGPGVQLADASGNGRHVRTSGYGSAAFSGVAGNARGFNGLTDWAETTPSPSLSPASFTFRAWVRLLSYPTAAGWGVIAASYGGNYQGWYVAVDAGGRLILSVASLPSSAPWLLSSARLALHRWYCLAVTYDGATREGVIYINGALDVAAAFAGFTAQSTLPLTFGRASWFNGYYLNAAMDEARLLPVAQSPADVLADYRSFPSAPPALSNISVISDWRFDDSGTTLADSSGNGFHGTFFGGATASGVLNGARAFNGAGDHARVPPSDAFSPASLTVRLGVKLLAYPEAAGWGVITASYGGNYQGWYLGVHATGRVIFSVASLPASSPWLLSTTALSLNRWYFVAATYDGPTRRATIYIDGAADVQALLPGFTPSPTTGVHFARASWYGGYYLNAATDEARMYPTAKTATEIWGEYRSFPAPPPPPPSAPVAEWRLDDPGATITDSSGNGRHGTAHGTSVASGLRNAARTFNGVSDSVEVPASSAFSPASFTIRAWVKLASLPSNWGVLVSNYAGNYQGWYLGVHSSGRLIFSVASLPSNAPWLLSASALPLNTWSHITATYDGATRAGSIYINGNIDAQAVFRGFTAQSTANLFVGRASWYDGYYLNATIDEVRLLATRQAPAEVLADYQSFP